MCLCLLSGLPFVLFCWLLRSYHRLKQYHRALHLFRINANNKIYLNLLHQKSLHTFPEVMNWLPQAVSVVNRTPPDILTASTGLSVESSSKSLFMSPIKSCRMTFELLPENNHILKLGNHSRFPVIKWSITLMEIPSHFCLYWHLSSVWNIFFSVHTLS